MARETPGQGRWNNKTKRWEREGTWGSYEASQDGGKTWIQFDPNTDPNELEKTQHWENPAGVIPATTPAPARGRQLAAPPGSSLTSPGEGEEYWQTVKGKFGEGTRAGEYWEGQKGFFNSPHQAEGAYADLANQWAQPGRGETNAYRSMDELMKAGPGEEWWTQNQQQFQAPSDAESYYGTMRSRLVDAPTATQAQEGRLLNEWGAIRNAEEWYGKAKGDLAARGYTERMADGYVPEASFSEQYLTGGGADAGLDAMFSRLRETEGRKLDTRAAAAGGFNTGAALRANQELGADLIGQQVAKRIALTNQADTQKMARFGEGRALMTGADVAKNNRWATGGTLSRNADLSAGERASGLQGVYGQIAGEQLSNRTLAGSLANNSSQARNTRLSTAGNLALGTQGQRTSRLTSAGAMGISADQQGLARGEARGRAASAGLDATIKRITSGVTAAGIIDKGELDKIMTGGTLAGNAQGLKENRITGGLDRTLAVGNSMAGKYSAQQEGAIREYLEAESAKLKGQLAAQGMRQDEIDAQIARLYQTFGIAVSAANVVNGSRK